MSFGRRSSQRQQPRRQMVGQRPSAVRRVAPVLLGVLVVAGAAFGVARVVSGSGSSGSAPSATPATPALAATIGQATGAPVGGIPCEPTEGTALRLAVHLAVFVDGSPRSIPAGVGVPGAQLVATGGGMQARPATCLYWLHTLSDDGVIRVTSSSPSQQSFTLGQFFAIWGQPLGPGQAGPAQGAMTVYVDGEKISGNPADVQLHPHTVIQIDVGSDVPPQSYGFPDGL